MIKAAGRFFNLAARRDNERNLDIYRREEHVEFGLAPFALHNLSRAIFR
ncbi:MAG: hypothetical protein KDJ77_16845 [Rhodobiaceae bacterium]|nr:hypothetical protein [Rhodobiaceae bacterium]